MSYKIKHFFRWLFRRETINDKELAIMDALHRLAYGRGFSRFIVKALRDQADYANALADMIAKEAGWGARDK